MFCETKRSVKSWAVFNFAAIFTVLCYHMWRSCLWLVDIDSKWLPPQLYQMRSYRNPTLLPYETCLLPYSNFCLQFILDTLTFCYVLLRLRLWFPQWAPGMRKWKGEPAKTRPNASISSVYNALVAQPSQMYQERHTTFGCQGWLMNRWSNHHYTTRSHIYLFFFVGSEPLLGNI